ncbi:hypothetical protein R6Q57_019326 [Mikania cordata]
MGAPKQKWMFLEEVALKAGVSKHGAGKWRTILKDPEFSSVLHLRSNVDLKDKWRNMSAMLNGWGSREKSRFAREKARLAQKKVQQTPKDDNPMALTVVDHSDDDAGDASGSPHTGGSKKLMIRLDNAIMEALNNMKEPCGSKNTIGAYIEQQYWAPPNFKRLLSMKLKFLTQNGKLIKTKRKYRIVSSENKTNEGREKGNSSVPRVDKDETSVPTKSQIDLEPQKMSPQEAVAAAAAQAVAEAEAAIAEAEEAARVADAAEADAEAIKAFAEAAMKALKGIITQRLGRR